MAVRVRFINRALKIVRIRFFSLKILLALLTIPLLISCGEEQVDTSGVSDKVSAAKLNEVVTSLQNSKFEGRFLDAEQIKLFVQGANIIGITSDGQRIAFSLTAKAGEKKKLLATFYDESWMTIRKSEGLWWVEEPDKVCGSLKLYRQSQEISGCFGALWVDESLVLENEEGNQVYWAVLDSLYDPSQRRGLFLLQPNKLHEKSDAWAYGVTVRYSEICNEYHHTGINEDALKLFQEIYAEDADFATAYGLLGEPERPGAVVKLAICLEMQELVEKFANFHKALNQ
ncbi:hypothetical protein [uncultured Sneathiella sp.]|uniref:hypothetical protein n=1 Tax=uncultured Sneathiella sp. TaxID=879315 RepID=UPI0025957343|nr:hypothetical protein [uncultured Sneathiella sp.]